MRIKIISLSLVCFILLGTGTLVFVKNRHSNQTKDIHTPINTQFQNNQDNGQPSIILDSQVCNQFSQDFVSQSLGKKIFSTKYLPSSNTYTCQYYLAQEANSPFVSLNIAYLNVEDQKNGQELLERTIEVDANIPMENFVVRQKDGNINAIYLVLHSMAYVRVDRSSGSISNQELTDFAIKVAHYINSQ